MKSRAELPPRSPEVKAEMNEFVAMRGKTTNPVLRNLLRRAIRRMEDLEMNNERLSKMVRDMGGTP